MNYSTSWKVIYNQSCSRNCREDPGLSSWHYFFFHFLTLRTLPVIQKAVGVRIFAPQKPICGFLTQRPDNRENHQRVSKSVWPPVSLELLTFVNSKLNVTLVITTETVVT